MSKDQRLQQQRLEKERKYEFLSKKINVLRQQMLGETRPEEKLRLEQLLEPDIATRKAVEAELEQLEAQLAA
jgi:hypothetical protein